MKYSLIFVASFLLLSCVDLGGSIGERLETLKPGPIIGICASACTMRIKVACVYSNARLGFHGAINGSSREAIIWGTKTMAEHYPPKLKQWYLDGPSKSDQVVWLTGKEVIEMGAKSCV